MRALALGACLLAATGCGDGDSLQAQAIESQSGSFLTDYQSARSPDETARAQPIDGDWLGVLLCPSGPYPVDLRLADDQARVTVAAAVGDPRKRTPFYREHADRSGVVDYQPATQALSITAPPDPSADPRQARGLQVDLLLAPGAPDLALMTVAETSAGRPRRCTDGIAGRGDQRERLGSFMARLAAIRQDRRDVVPGDCPDAYGRWLDQAVVSDDGALQTQAFEDAFGTLYLDLPAEQLLAASALMSGSCLAHGEPAQRIARTRAAASLRDWKRYQSSFVASHRRLVVDAWRAWVEARLNQDAVTTRRVASELRRLPHHFAMAGDPPAVALDGRLAAVTDALEADDLELGFVQRIEAARDDFRELLAIAQQAESRGDIDLAVIGRGLDYYLAPAAERHVRSVTKPAEARFLAAWLEQVQGGSCPARDPRSCRTAADLLEDRLTELAEDYAEAEAEAAEGIADQPQSLERLAALVAFERSLRGRYGILATWEAFEDGIEARRELRAEDQEDLTEELLDRIREARTAPELRTIRDRYFLNTEIEGHEALLGALDARLATTRPFAELAGGNYLDALYNQDFEALRELDRRYLEGITPLMQFGMQQSMSFGPLVDAITGRRPGATASDLARAMHNLTALYAVMGTYLVAYQDRFDDCLGADARTFVITTRTDQVTVDGFGNEIRRQEGWTSRDSYRVKAAFAGQFQALFAAATGSAQARLLDLLANDAQIQRLRSGTAQLMRRLDCDAAEVVQFEAGMLAYDREIRRRARR